jgi:hypothetical protein
MSGAAVVGWNQCWATFLGRGLVGYIGADIGADDLFFLSCVCPTRLLGFLIFSRHALCCASVGFLLSGTLGLSFASNTSPFTCLDFDPGVSINLLSSMVKLADSMAAPARFTSIIAPFLSNRAVYPHSEARVVDMPGRAERLSQS